MQFEKCKSEIEQGLGWGDSTGWTTKDYEALGARIHERTGVTLSVATLKRLWGKVKYDSKPTPTTLNTLAQYLGYESWRSYCVAREPKKKSLNWVWSLMAVPIIAAAFLLIPNKKIDVSLFTFSSKKVVDIGVPNTVVFDYDALAASDNDSIFIQQSWDKRLSRQVRRDQKQHTSIYYYPGFFEAKLVVNNQIIKEHNLLIKTDGWLPIVEQPGTPIYFKQQDAIHDGVLQLPLSTISRGKETPWTAYYLVQDMNGLMSDDAVFETSLKNDDNSDSNPCQYVEIRLQFEGPAVIIPLSTKSCVSTLGIADTDATERDLSAFGVDFNDWVNVKCVIKDKIAEIYINNKSAIRLKITGGRAKMVEVGYRFKGTGSVDFVKLANNDGKVFL